MVYIPSPLCYTRTHASISPQLPLHFLHIRVIPYKIVLYFLQNRVHNGYMNNEPQRNNIMSATRYDVIDIKTQKVVGTYATRVRARRAADKKDLAYGAIRYIVKAIYPE